MAANSELDDEPLDREPDDYDDDFIPPAPERIAKRALCLTAVTARALLEQEDPKDALVRQDYEKLKQWVTHSGFSDELELEEKKVVETPLGELDPQTHINSVWRLEGLGVLCWMLKAADPVPYDELVSPPDLYDAVGFLNYQESQNMISNPNIRSAQEVSDYSKQIFGLHWRVRDFTLRPARMDFEDFAKNCWFGPLDVSQFRMVHGDLAIGEHSISDAPEKERRKVLSASMERHLAIRWLQGWSEVYSETDTST